MGDAGRTAVPLLSGYKYGLAWSRLLETATGGLKLRASQCRLNLLQLPLYLFPLALATPFIIMDALGVWREHYLAAVYALAHTLAVLSIRTSVYCSARLARRETNDDDDDDDESETTACCSHRSLSFVFSSKHIVSVFIHCLFACLLLSFTASFVLLPRGLTEHFSLPGAVVVGTIGWLVSCSAHYSLSVSGPHEVAVYRPTDLLGLEPLSRPAHFIFCTSAIIAVRLAVSDSAVAGLTVKLLYVAVCLLPLGWVVGCLPPLDALLPWAMELVLTRLMGGSQMATDLRLLIVFLVSLVSTVVVGVTAGYSSSTAALLLAAASGYLLSLDLISTTCCCLSRLRERRSQTAQEWKVFIRHLVLESLRGCVLITISLLLVYFSSRASGESKKVAGRVLGSCVIALSLTLSISGATQGVYVLGLLRNPLHPWRSEDTQRYKTCRKRLSYGSILPRLLLTYLSPLLMLAFLSVKVESDTPHRWLTAVAIARIFRKVWQNSWSALVEVSVGYLLLLVLPEDTWWAGLGVGLQTLLVGIGLDVCQEFLQKLWFGFTLFLKFLTEDGKKVQRWVYVSVAVGSPLFLLLLLVAALFSSLISAPLLPLFTLPVFLVSFPRTLRFWPSLSHYGSSYHRCRDSVYYQHDAPHLSRALLRVFSAGPARGQPGDLYLLRCQDRTAIASVLERGHRFFTLNIRGLEIEETSCHTLEASKIDDMFSGTYTPNGLRFWFNWHPLSTMRPVDSVVIKTYSSSRISLTGIIDQPRGLERLSGNLLKCIVWVLHCFACEHSLGERWGEGKRELREGGRGRHRVRWGRRNKIVPVTDSETVVPLKASSPQRIRQQPQEVVEETSDPWTSLESIVGLCPATDPSTAANAMCGLIPVDVPLNIQHWDSGHQSSERGEEISPNEHQLPFPAEWLDFPLKESQFHSLLSSFPIEWLDFISGDTLSSVAFKRLCLTCFSIVDVPCSSCGSTQTRPHHIHSSFCGELPHSTNRNWLTHKPALHQLILKAYRYAVKLMCDEAALGEAGDSTELSDYLQTYQTTYHIGREGEPDWNSAVLNQTPNLFSMGKSPDNDAYTALVLTLQDEVVHIGQLSLAAVQGVWSNLSLELFYLTNDDEERHSIQAHPSLLRNLTIQAADPPLGYSVFSSGLSRCPSIT